MQHFAVPVSKLHHAKHDGLYLARLDLLPAPASGNKGLKLEYNLQEAERLGTKLLITFGGAYSNHLYATAEVAQFLGYKSIGIVRGEVHEPLNPTLQYCMDKGMQLFYMSREEYRKKADSLFLSHWMKEHHVPEGYIIPEGGSNSFAVKGVAELIELLPKDTDIIATACGTGATLAGLIAGAHKHQEIWGFAALKGGDFLVEDVNQLLVQSDHAIDRDNWKLFTNYHFGGYAKTTDDLLSFVQQFQREQGVLLDPTYTCKMMYGLFDLAQKEWLPQDKKIVALHTGGLQAWDGLPEKKRIFLSE